MNLSFEEKIEQLQKENFFIGKTRVSEKGNTYYPLIAKVCGTCCGIGYVDSELNVYIQESLKWSHQRRELLFKIEKLEKKEIIDKLNLTFKN